jgi:hypothetical protein
MKALIAAAAMAVLSVPALAQDYSVIGSNSNLTPGTPGYDATAKSIQEQSANAHSFGNACLTRGGDDPRFEGSANTCPSKKVRTVEGQQYNDSSR